MVLHISIMSVLDTWKLLMGKFCQNIYYSGYMWSECGNWIAHLFHLGLAGGLQAEISFARKPTFIIDDSHKGFRFCCVY